MKEIPLNQGKFALVDDDDFEYLNQWKWYAWKNRNCWYSTRSEFISKRRNSRRPNTKIVIMHRVIMNAPKGIDVDHINGDALDNRKINLRLVTNRQNAQNRHVTTSSKYPGVSWFKTRNKWRSYITIGGKFKHLGYFEDEKEAAMAYEKALRHFVGEELICKT